VCTHTGEAVCGYEVETAERTALLHDAVTATEGGGGGAEWAALRPGDCVVLEQEEQELQQGVRAA
jgi:hypothetical protein